MSDSQRTSDLRLVIPVRAREFGDTSVAFFIVPFTEALVTCVRQAMQRVSADPSLVQEVRLADFTVHGDNEDLQEGLENEAWSLTNFKLVVLPDALPDYEMLHVHISADRVHFETIHKHGEFYAQSESVWKLHWDQLKEIFVPTPEEIERHRAHVAHINEKYDSSTGHIL